jgi:hypothetical protein
MNHPAPIRGLIIATAASLAWGPLHAIATWSIVMVDVQTREVAVGSATCLTGFDLQAGLAVAIVDVGGGAAQSAVDVSGQNRLRIHDELLAGTPPNTILELLDAQDNQHQLRQYGIVDVLGRSATFTGSGAGAWAGGVIGQVGSIHYAVQGNVLTGSPVVEMAEAAILATAGDLPAKLMAAMEAARAMGGDGRCSCQAGDPTACGAPPATFTKTAHVGFVIVARTGDTDGGCASDGCAAGDYFMNFNVAGAQSGDPDPVFTMQANYDAWREAMLGVPDGRQSTWAFDLAAVPADGTAMANLTFELRDWQGAVVQNEDAVVSVHHDPDGPGLSTIGAVQNHGDGVYSVPLTAASEPVVDRLRITVDDGSRPVTLIPLPEFISAHAVDSDRDGDIDATDAALFLPCVTGPDTPVTGGCFASDFDGGGQVDLIDYSQFQLLFTGRPCTVLHVLSGPQAMNIPCGESFSASVQVLSDPLPAFQWLLDGEQIAGATTTDYFVAAADDEHHGDYSVRVSNACGAVITEEVLIRVFPNPCP